MSFLLRLFRGSFALLAVIVFIGPQIVPAQADTEAELSAAEAHVEALVGTIHAEEAAATALQAELNTLAGEIEAAQSTIEGTRVDIDRTREEIAAIQRKLDSLRSQLEDRAVEAYVSAGTGLEFVLGASTLTEFTDRMLYLDVLASQDADLAGQTQNQANVLASKKHALQTALAAQTSDLERLSQDRAALDAKFAEQQERLDRVTALRAEAEDLVARLERKLKAEQVPVIPPSTSGGSGDGIPGPLHACPVNGPHAYADTFGILHEHVGWSHIHEGNDIISPYGTPIVAPFAGVAVSGSSSTGGIYVTVAGGEGSVIMMHMSSLGSLGSVKTGEVVGYIGTTGNATGPPTHFEWHPGGGGVADPYPQLNEVC